MLIILRWRTREWDRLPVRWVVQGVARDNENTSILLSNVQENQQSFRTRKLS